MRISPRLRLAPLWPALAALLVGGALLLALLPPVFERSAAAQLADAAAVLEPVVAARLGGGREELQSWLSKVAADSELRLTVIRGDGVVLADSDRTADEVTWMDNHAGRPEVAAALANGRGSAVRTSATTHRSYVYVARAFAGADRGRFVLRLAQPVGRLWEIRGRLAAVVAVAGLAASAVTLLLSWWLGRRLFGPLERLIAAAGEMASGRRRRPVEIPEEAELAALAGSLNRLAGSVEAQVAAVGAERDLLRAILASMSEGVLVVDREGRALLVNPAFQRLFGLAGEVEGKLPLEVARYPELAAVLEEAATRGEAAARQVEVRGAARRTIALVAAALAAESGGVVVVARDVTEAHRVNAMRRDFVANVSHELKTPLAAIRGFAETLADGALAEPETARRFTRRILDQCRRLQALLDDLLTLSRLESVELPLERKPVDLAALIAREVELLARVAEERGVTVAVAADGEVPPVVGDAGALARLVANLLDNAIKYNRPGGRAEVSVERRGDAALLTVADTGLGIPPDALPRIFERFYRVDKGRARDEGGTGLGLAIVKHVAQAHGGRVEVESEMGRGTTFRVVLPRSGENGARRSRRSPAAGPGTAGDDPSTSPAP